MVDESTTLSIVKGRELKRRRHGLGYSQPEFAKLLGVAEMTVSRWERSVHRIPEPVALLVRQMQPKKGVGKKRKS